MQASTDSEVNSLPLGSLEAPSKSGPDAHVLKLPAEDNTIWNGIQHLFNQVACLFFLPITISGKAIGLIFSIINKLKAEDLSLEGKVVVITGASSGLGEALAHIFYKEGCRLVLASRRYSELARVRDALLSSCSRKGNVVPPVIIQLDLGEMGKIQDVVNSILRIYGHVDILVNNAGVSYRGEISETAPDVDSRIMNINYLGTVMLTKALLPSMMERKSGRILMIGSLQAKLAIPFRSAYAASKHALQAFSDCLRAEVSCYNIGVTVVNPGYIKTNLSLNALTGTGEQYGQMDKTTETGLDSTVAALKIVAAVRRKQDELMLCAWYYHIVVYVRSLFPKLFFAIMERRATKAKKKPS
uniref:EOG090X07KM n=1 Tax=Evadne anonyx TaxID=141404 RepID=A0A9N6WQ42_9CRUS|nr:EOG090X07KM [Evadne anonyx]